MLAPFFILFVTLMTVKSCGFDCITADLPLPLLPATKLTIALLYFQCHVLVILKCFQKMKFVKNCLQSATNRKHTQKLLVIKYEK